MELKDLHIFARVAALQNLSAVAQEIGVSPGTVSKRIQALEDDLAVRLLDRSTRSTRLTEEGRTFLDRAERVLGEMDRARDEISATTGQPAGRLSISAPASLMRQLIAPALITFIEAFPAIDVKVDITDHIANLHEQGYDAAIRSGALPDSTLKAKRLVSDKIIMVAAPIYVERHGAPQRPADLERHGCLVHGDGRNWTLHRDGQADTVRVSGRLTSDCGAFLHAAAVDGAGLLRTSQLAVTDDLANGRLLHVMPEYDLAGDAAVWAVYPNSKHAMPRLRVFLDHLAEHCRTRLGGAGRHNNAATSAGSGAGSGTGSGGHQRRTAG